MAHGGVRRATRLLLSHPQPAVLAAAAAVTLRCGELAPAAQVGGNASSQVPCTHRHTGGAALRGVPQPPRGPQQAPLAYACGWCSRWHRSEPAKHAGQRQCGIASATLRKCPEQARQNSHRRCPASSTTAALAAPSAQAGRLACTQARQPAGWASSLSPRNACLLPLLEKLLPSCLGCRQCTPLDCQPPSCPASAAALAAQQAQLP